MKKNILIALFALLAVALNGNAQNNTYNMVIEMVNGSKITIGPNDVKNISFNNGELVITGENINTLVEQQSKADERIESLAKTVDGLSAQLADALKQVQDYFNRVYSKDQVDALLKDVQSGSTPDLSNYAEKKDVAAVQGEIAYNTAALKEEIAKNTATLKDQINALSTKIKDLEAAIADVQSGSTPDLSNYAEKKDVAAVQTHLASVQQEIAENTAALRDQINAAQNKTAELGALVAFIQGEDPEKGTIDYVKNLIEQLEAKITENQNQIVQNKANLQLEIDQNKANKADLQKEIDALKEWVKVLDSIVSANQ